jgi:DNA-directed RNA polymerase specialized sigma subunit
VPDHAPEAQATSSPEAQMLEGLLDQLPARHAAAELGISSMAVCRAERRALAQLRAGQRA